MKYLDEDGFTLIEVILAITIASMLALAMFSVFNQFQKSALSINRAISIDSRIAILQGQLEMDISGAFIPNITIEKPAKPSPPITSEDKSKNQKEQKENKEKVEQPKPEDKQPQKKEVLEKAFYSVNNNNILKELSLITCNPLQIYGQKKPRIARVSYFLKESRGGDYSLFRKESPQIEYGADKKAVEYELTSNIKELSIEYTTPIKEQLKKGNLEFKTVNDWSSKKSEKEYPMPQFVKVNVILWDDQFKKLEQKFELRYTIYAFDDQIELKKPKEKKEAKEQKELEGNEKRETNNQNQPVTK